MPRIIESLSPRKGRPSSYEWDAVLDGEARAFVGGVQDDDGNVIVEGDFYCEPKSFESQARSAASKRKTETTRMKVGVRHVDPVTEVVGEGETAVTFTLPVVEIASEWVPIKAEANADA